MRLSITIYILILAGLNHAFAERVAFFEQLHDTKITFANPTDVCEDGIGRLWVVDQGILYYVEGNEVNKASKKFPLITNSVSSIAYAKHTIFIQISDTEYISINLINNQSKKYNFKKSISAISTVNQEVVLNSSNSYYFPISHTPFKEEQKAAQFEIESDRIKYTKDGSLFAPLIQNNLIFQSKLLKKNEIIYSIYKGSIYRFNKNIFHALAYHYFDELKAINTRSAIHLSNSAYFISADRPSSLYIAQNDSLIDILNLPVNKYIKSDFKERVVFHAVRLSDNQLLMLDEKMELYFLDLNTYKIEKEVKINREKLDLKNIYKDSKQNVWIGTYSNKIVRYHHSSGSLKIYSNKDCKDMYDTYRIYEDRSGIIWVGQAKGFYAFDPITESFTSFDTLFSQDGTNLSQIPISAIAHDNTNKFWIGTYAKGLFYINYNSLKATINSGKKINKVVFNSLFESEIYNQTDIKYVNTSDRAVYIRSKNGLTAFDPKTMDSRNLSITKGFPEVLNNNYNAIIDDSHYIMGAIGGYAILNLTSTDQTANFNPIQRSKIDDTEEGLYQHGLNKKLSLPHDYSYLLLNTISSEPSPIDNSYQVSINDQKWQNVRNDQIIFTSHLIGSNTIKIKNKQPSWFSNVSEFTYEITIINKWYNTLFFKFFIASLIAFVGYLLFSYYRRSRSYQMQIATLEMETLRNQMNPHFISNSLNSINYYILENKTDEASQFIIKFSKLIRRILNNTAQEFITIEEEIEALRMYIDIEKMRFKDKFEYQLTIDSSIDTAYKIPSMILQPIVENSIWHGIMQKNENGNLSINVYKSNKNVVVEINDDGIGIEKSKEINSKRATKRKSYGQTIITKRLYLLNEQYDKQYSIAYQDLSTDSLEYPGTKVTLTL